MKNDKTGFNSIDEYIAAFPEAVQKLLMEMRANIKAAAPEAEEKISYQMPTFYLKGNLVHFAAYKKHIGFYPTSSGIAAFQQQLAAYKSSKGAVQFPLDQPIPYELVAKIVKFRVKENLAKAEAKSKKKKTTKESDE
ncbi:MAG TPA: hypothetical protein DEH25_16615 [Chloroflexi bacterium]|nr:hypothetical protein [Chloroflexota bacterium]